MDGKTIALIALIIVLAFAALWCASPSIRAAFNEKDYELQKVDEATSYEVLKEVEDTCRALIVSYNSDVSIYNTYKDCEGEKSNWAEQAKIRANKTAFQYNEYILKNSFVWAGNVPNDIRAELEILT